MNFRLCFFCPIIGLVVSCSSFAQGQVKGGYALRGGGLKRLVSQVRYDHYTGSAIPSDSFRFYYSEVRGSAFDYLNLEYDPFNYGDIHHHVLPDRGYIDFDSVRNYFTGGTPNYLASNRPFTRTYDSSGRLVNKYSAYGVWEIYDFEYNVDGFMTRSVRQDYDINSMIFRQTLQTVCLYEQDGRRRRDTTFGKGSAGWQAAGVRNYVYNAVRLPEQINYSHVNVPNPYISRQDSISYDTSGFIRRIIYKLYPGVLTNSAKDSFGYEHAMITYRNHAEWNDTFSRWDIKWVEHRTMNAMQLPDSIWHDNYQVSPAQTVFSYKMHYDADGYPIRKDIYEQYRLLPKHDIRWHYEPYPPNAVGLVYKHDNLLLYPIPAAQFLNINGRFANGTKEVRVVSLLGLSTMLQVIETGDGYRADVSSLPAGVYYLLVMDSNNLLVFGRFVKL